MWGFAPEEQVGGRESKKGLQVASQRYLKYAFYVLNGKSANLATPAKLYFILS